MSKVAGHFLCLKFLSYEQSSFSHIEKILFKMIYIRSPSPGFKILNTEEELGFFDHEICDH
ncbi:hypothetical protein BpHYR1_005400 [Brachionus plicatilis]|uniref:Uncharacterized protein n=1 Tax=Brachionus plicatilis TaxID=10195 RepID=A0A3M7R0G0_BRAPC|nr:hypothetical protein BpHYR1_005400 [Brachionus plicatilis]